MKDTLLFLLKNIVDTPDDVVVDEQDSENGKILVIHVHPSDMGKVIGKSGRIIRALRDIIKLIATKQNTYIDIMIAEENITQTPPVAEAKQG
jgi:hypothetical protein